MNGRRARMAGRVAAAWRRGVTRVGGWWQAFFVRFNALRPVAAIAGALLVQFVAVALVPQGRELVGAQFIGLTGGGDWDDAWRSWARVGAFALALVLLGWFAWFAGRAFVLAAFGPRRQWRAGSARRWLPRLLAAFAMLPYVIAFLRSPDTDAAGGALVLGSAALLLGWLVWRCDARALLAAWRGRPADTIDARRAASDRWIVAADGRVFAAASLAGFALLVALLVSPVALARWLGAPVLVALGALSMLATLSLAYRLLRYPQTVAPTLPGAWRYLPVAPILLLWALGVNLLGGADNHAVASRGAAGAPPLLPAAPFAGGPMLVRKPGIADAYAAWARTVPAGSPRPVPLVVVATAGGASRAGYWTAAVLGALDGDPLRRHLFAISSVSGGGLGAAGFVAAAACGLPPPRAAAAMRALAGDDHLSPAAAGLLYADTLQRFVPPVVFPDRAAALERSFEASWATARGADCRVALTDPFLRAWSADRWVPLWFSNGTRVEDGRRVITAPVRIDDAQFAEALDFHALVRRDVPLSTAITNGARFPLVSPTGGLSDIDGVRRGGIIDGGYFENGGIDTAVDVLRAALDAHERAGAPFPIAPVLLVIDNDDAADPDARASLGAPLSAAAATRLLDQPAAPRALAPLAPLLGLYNARGARGAAGAARAGRDIAGGRLDPRALVFRFGLCPFADKRTSFNWTLSEPARRRLDAAFARGSVCSPRWRATRDCLGATLDGAPAHDPRWRACPAVARSLTPPSP